VQLTPKGATTAAAAVTPTAATTSTSDSSLPLVFGILGTVIGLVAGALAVLALRRRASQA
jgi:subtilase family serine protease